MYSQFMMHGQKNIKLCQDSVLLECDAVYSDRKEPHVSPTYEFQEFVYLTVLRRLPNSRNWVFQKLRVAHLFTNFHVL